MYAGFEFREGDIAAVAVNVAERGAAHAQLRAVGCLPHEVEPGPVA
jgi:hypothetical protein